MDTVVEELTRLTGADLDAAGPDTLRTLAAAASRVRSWLDAFDTRLVRRSNAVAPERDPAEPLRNRGRREAAAVKDRATTTEQVPEMGAALAGGAITAGHVDALTRAANTLSESARDGLADHGAALVDAAASMTPEQFGRHCHDLARSLATDDGTSRHEHIRRQRHVARWICRESGLHKTLIAVDALTDAKLWNVLNAAVDTARVATQDDDLSFAHLQCDAVVDHIVNAATSPGVERVPEVTVLIDHATLIGGLHDTSVCETSDGHDLPVDTIRRLCCDADIIPAVYGSDGELLDLGRATRLANRAQRRALRAMYRSCGHPDCDVPFDRCRIHHILFWEHFGPTDLANLLPLCDRHHHAVHEGGWTLTMTSDRTITLYRPDGTVAHHGRTTNRCHTQPDRPPLDPPDPPPPPADGLVARMARDLEAALDRYLQRDPDPVPT